MPSAIPPEFQRYLEIALRMVDQGPRRDFAAKLPHVRDDGARRIAVRLIERLAMAGWKIEEPAPPPIDRGV